MSKAQIDLLTVKKIESFKFVKGESTWKSDGSGLGVLLLPSGAKTFQYRYQLRVNGKVVNRLVTIGKFPEITLVKARSKRDSFAGQRAEGLDPWLEIKKGREAYEVEIIERLPDRSADGTFAEKPSLNDPPIPGSFRDLATQWLDAQTQWTERHRGNSRRSLENHIYFGPNGIGDMPIAQITKPDVHAALDHMREKKDDDGNIIQKGTHSMLGTVKDRISAIFEYAEGQGLITYNPTYKIEKGLPTHTRKQFRHIKFESFPELWEGLESSPRDELVVLACKFQAITIARPGAVRRLEWTDIDFKKRIWELPKEKGKNHGHDKYGPIHLDTLYPLSDQAIEILQRVKEITGDSTRLVFPGRNNTKPMSDNTFCHAIQSVGFKATAHGFRHTASTFLYSQCYSIEEDGEGLQKELIGKQRFEPMVIEKAMDHTDKNDTRDTYNKSEFLPQRRVMLQYYADRVLPDGLQVELSKAA